MATLHAFSTTALFVQMTLRVPVYRQVCMQLAYVYKRFLCWHEHNMQHRIVYGRGGEGRGGEKVLGLLVTMMGGFSPELL